MAQNASTFRDETSTERRPGQFRRKGVDGPPMVTDPTGDLTQKGTVRLLTYARPSNYGGQIENRWNLEKWTQREMVAGIAIHYAQACERLEEPEMLVAARALLDGDRKNDKDVREQWDKIARRALETAKANIAAERGTHTHTLTEDHDLERDWVARAEAGEELGIPAEVARELVAAWREMLTDYDLEVLATEATVVNDNYRAAGSLDRIVRCRRELRFAKASGEIAVIPAGTVLVLDVKTGAHVDKPAYAIQIFLYADARPYDPDTDVRSDWPWPVDQQHALIAHLGVAAALDGQPGCNLVYVDLAKGRHGADLVRLAKAFENDGEIFSVAQLDTIEVGDAATREGAGADGTTGSATSAVSVSNSPASAPPAAGDSEGVGIPLVESPAAAPTRRITDAPDPARLELVDARRQLADAPDPGADLSGPEHESAWAAAAQLHAQLDVDARAWYGSLVSASRRHGVTIHAREQRSLRTFEIHRGLLTLCEAMRKAS